MGLLGAGEEAEAEAHKAAKQLSVLCLHPHAGKPLLHASRMLLSTLNITCWHPRRVLTRNLCSLSLCWPAAISAGKAGHHRLVSKRASGKHA